MGLKMETETIRHLADAAESLLSARETTQWAAVDDECMCALAKVQRAMRAAIGDDVEPPPDVTDLKAPFLRAVDGASE